MERRFHFISGLPRSGSTLLSAILSQNPRFHAGISGPMGGVFETLLGELSNRNEFSVFITNDQRRRMLRSVFDSYYGPEYDAGVIFDTHRIWCSKMRHLKQLFPVGKVIACVRDVSWIVDSIEQLIRKNTFEPSAIFSYQPGGTVYSRAEGLVSGDGLVGFAFNALKEAFYGNETANLMVLRYETLVSDPAKAIAAVYAFIDEPVYSHDFENIHFQADAFDERLGTPGLHTVHHQVGMKKRASVLPPDVFRRFEKDAFWLDPIHNPHGVKVV